MIKNQRIALIAVAVLLAGVGLAFSANKSKESLPVAPPATVQPLLGCFQATLGKDLYSLAILTHTGENVSGTMRYKNFQKDSSSGTFTGTYKNEILLADYSFHSEGSYSVRQVIFKGNSDGFNPGYGTMNSTGDRFVNLGAITYDSKVLYMPSKQGC